ncbi:MAG: hypothetical protein M5U34_19215 [Chloroflexi bacterium]|nr:hypothetical protein [Chloroflexota bacterium]
MNTDNAYHVTSDKGFMGQAWIFNPSDQEHKFALICLLDYQQVPCSPEQTLENIITVTAQTEHFVSMYLSQLTAGLHDLGLLIIREPYQNIDTGLNHSSTDLVSIFSL